MSVEPLPGRRRALAHLLGSMLRAERWRTFVVVVLITAGNLSGMGVAYATKLVVDAVGAGERAGVSRAAIVLALSVALSLVATYPVATIGMTLRERAAFAIEQRLVSLTAGLPGIEHYERPEYLDRVQLLQRGSFSIAEAVASVVDNASTFILLVASTALLFGVHPLLALLPLAALPSFAAALVKQRRARAWDESMGPLWRLKRGLRESVAWVAAFGPELRLFGAAATVVRRQRQAAWEIIRSKTRLAVTNGLLQVAGDMVFAAAKVAAVAFVAIRALEGALRPGDVVLTVVLASRVDAHVTNTIANVRYLYDLLQTIARLQWLEAHAATGRRAVDTSVALPALLSRGIRIERVSFAYPGTVGPPVLTEVDLDLPAGACVALVGENGAGKTTLVKLLCRFYEPTGGCITVDGLDIASVAPEAWRLRTSAAFQDFARFELTVAQSVALGNADDADDVAAAARAIERAGASEFVNGLPSGIHTRLGRRFPNATEPSGGEWQKVAIARSLMRTEPLLFALDEPAAGLDPQAEHDLFVTARAAADANPANGVTLFVSHRFSTVRLADLIYVIERGRVVERGSHDDLVNRAGGRYAELFERQARAYR